METRNSLAAVLLVLGSLAYNTVSGPRTDAASSTAGKSVPTAVPHIGDAKDQAPWDTLDEFVGLRRKGEPEYLIATLPDPIDTHLSIFFDRIVESVTRAAGAAGYTFDRYWIPWRENPYNSTSKPAVLAAQEDETRQREQQPGLLLFRGRDRDLAIFLVGETPTAGIREEEFTAALAWIRKRKPNEKIRVSGPTFSGSFPSLAAAIQGAGGPAQFNVVSGSTTSDDSILDYRNKWMPDFRTTIHPDAMAMCAFVRRINAESGGIQPLLAVLSEGDTAFGEDVRQRDCGSRYRIMNFPFPRDIARLRNAYHEEFLASPVPDAYKTVSRDGVTLTLKDSNTGHDSVPSFSHDQTPVSQDVVLQNLAAALRREEVQYAAIVATDPLDTFFLARFLASNAPNIRLFQLDADLLFVRPPESLPLAGMLSVTTYPLFTRNQLWTSKVQGPEARDSRLVFASRYAQGVYNATLSVLGRNDLLEEYTSPWEETGFPALWLTASGRNGYWPVAILSELESESDKSMIKAAKGPPRGLPRAEDPSHMFIVLVWIFLFGAIAMLSAFLLSRVSAANWLSDFKIGADEKRRAPYMLVCALSLAAMALCLAAPLWKLFGERRLAESLVFMAPATTALIVFLAFAVILAWRGFQGGRFLMLTAWFGFGALVVLGYRVLTPDPFHQDYFFAYRAVNISSGLSPILPLIFLFSAYATWGWTHWQRQVLIEERCQHLPKLNESISRAAYAVTESFDVACPVGSFLALLPVGFIIFKLCRPHLRTLEPLRFERFYDVALPVFLCLIVLTASQLLRGWVRVERLLEQIELHPIRFALSDLPPDRGLAPIWQGNIRKRNHVLLARSVDCLRALAGEDRPIKPGLGQDLSDLQQAVQKVTFKVAAGERESVEQVGAMHEAIRIANGLDQELKETYWNQGSSEIVGSREAGDQDRPSMLAAEFIALGLLSYIRYVMLHLRNLLSFLTIAFLFLMSSLNCYPFQAPQVIGAVTVTLFVVLAVLVVWVFVRMNGNAVVKRITTSKEDKRDFSFWIRLAETGALPLLAVVAANVPGAGQFLFSWLGPLVDRLH